MRTIRVNLHGTSELCASTVICMRHPFGKLRLKTNSDSTVILALVMLCKPNGKDARMEPVWYQEMGTVRAFNIATIGCATGLIEVGDRLGRSYGSQRVVMHRLWEPEYDSEDDNN